MRIGIMAILTVYAYLFEIANQLDLWAILDKYGFPTAAVIAACWFIWNRQKASDQERNGLIQQNNLITERLIKAVEAGNACKFEK